MKKIKFLSGMSAFALAAVALATTFTSCEKEEFNVDVTPINAKAIVQPTVLSIESDGTKDVTASATITYSAGSSFEGNPTLAATSTVVTAVYDGMEASVTVNIPALEAGQFTTIPVLIVLSKDYDFVLDEEAIDADPEESVKHVDNYNMYWYSDYKFKYTDKSGVLFDEDSEEYFTEDLTEQQIIQNAFASLVENKYSYVEDEAIQEITVYANSRTTVTVTYAIAATKYSVVRKAATKAEGEPEVLATITAKKYTTTLDASLVNQAIPGHGHSHGHGHGHGHADDANAGGGIIITD